MTASALACKYESVFCIVLAAACYLGRENAELVYPVILYLLLLLLSLNFAAIVCLRLWPAKAWLSALIILANCGTVTGILAYSGGPQSNLWVLYLLPVYTVSMLLSGREAAWITAGILGFNAVFYGISLELWNAAVIFELLLKNGILLFSSALTWRLASAERRSSGEVRRQREKMERLMETARKQATRDERSSRLARVGMLSAGIVHDLKTPLTVIGGYAEICLGYVSLDPTFREDLRKIQKSVRICQEMVSSILGAASEDPAPRSSCDLQELLTSALSSCESVLKTAGIKVELRLGPGPLPVTACREELVRLLRNLIANAAQAMGHGGVLTLHTRSDGRRRVLAVVEDTGPGFSEQALAKIFKPFATTRAQEGGTGLGLYLSRDIALRHGGGLEVENRPEGGARCVLSLPSEAKLVGEAPPVVVVALELGDAGHREEQYAARRREPEAVPNQAI